MIESKQVFVEEKIMKPQFNIPAFTKENHLKISKIYNQKKKNVEIHKTQYRVQAIVEFKFKLKPTKGVIH